MNLGNDDLRLLCVIQGESEVFPIDVPELVWRNPKFMVGDLKEKIQEERRNDSLAGVDAHSLVLWKPKEGNPVDVKPKQTLPGRVASITRENGEELDPADSVLTVFPLPLPPLLDRLHIIVRKQPTATISPSSSGNSNLSLKSPPPWLVEIHSKLWGRRDLFDQLFRTAKLTKTDFIELQCLLHHHNPERNSRSYVAKDVLTIKAEFLRSKSLSDTTAAVAHFDTKSNGGLAPRLVFDTSADVTPPMPSDTADEDAGAATDTDSDTMDVDPNPVSSIEPYIKNDATYLSTGVTEVFPCTIRYMDLTGLGLKHPIRVPQLMLLRNECGNMVDVFNKRQMGVRGSAVFTGQPGIGKTCLLYYIFVLCLIRAQPIVFQDMAGKVFLINADVRRRKGIVEVPGDDVLTLVDADDKNCTPHHSLLDVGNLRILLMSSPRTHKDRKWLTQSVRETGAAFVVEPWSQEELLIASFFLADSDITLDRFQETTRICGTTPRRCFEAAVSRETLLANSNQIIAAIKQHHKLKDAITDAQSGEPIHRAFEVCPSPNSKYWDHCLLRPISDWALSHIMVELDQQGANAAYKYYQTIQGSRTSATFGGKMFENKVHKFFRSITRPRRFTIRSLEKPYTTFDIEFSSRMKHFTFGATQNFAGQLASSISDSSSCYLRPLCPIFPTFDSFLYQCTMSQPGCQPLIGLQVTTAHDHPINVKGLAAIQTCLTPKIPNLKALRPTTAAKWIILFVVPDSMVASFVLQGFTDAKKYAHWKQKTTQYVLGLPEEEVMKSLDI